MGFRYRPDYMAQKRAWYYIEPVNRAMYGWILGVLLFFVLLCACVSCTPRTYVSGGYGGGYDNGYISPIYDPGMTVVYHGGVRGYYVGSIFHPMVVVNGASGYYNSGGRFVSNHVSVQQSVQSGKPWYRGPSSSGMGRQTNTGTYTDTGSMTRGSRSGSSGSTGGFGGFSSPRQTTRPDYGSGGSMTRGSRSTYTPSSSPSMSRPSYGGGGSMSRGSGGFSSPSRSSSYSRPSYSSGSGSSMSRGGGRR